MRLISLWSLLPRIRALLEIDVAARSLGASSSLNRLSSKCRPRRATRGEDEQVHGKVSTNMFEQLFQLGLQTETERHSYRAEMKTNAFAHISCSFCEAPSTHIPHICSRIVLHISQNSFAKTYPDDTIVFLLALQALNIRMRCVADTHNHHIVVLPL